MIGLISTSDTDLLSARSSGAAYRLANPSRLAESDLPAFLTELDLVVVRILGGRRAWEDGLDTVLAAGVPVLVLGGEQVPDAELMALSTVSGGIVAEAHRYLAEGGPDNLAQLANFLSDAILLTGLGFRPPANMPSWGELELPEWPETEQLEHRPRIAVLYYRAHQAAGNTAFVRSLGEAIWHAGGQPQALYSSSLRTADPGLFAALRGADALVVTMLAAGGSLPAAVSAGGQDEDWDIGALAELDIPILQGLCLTSSRQSWLESDDGLSPLDSATQVAIPEFDGRLITVPFSFKEVDSEGLISYVPDLERTDKVARIAVSHGRLRHRAPAERRVVLMLSAYPTKNSRIGNAVGLDTPASVLRLLSALASAGYDVGPLDGPDALPGLAAQDGDALMHALIAAGGQDEDWLTAEQLAGNPVRISAAEYASWFAELDEQLRARIERHWGPPPGQLYVDRSRDPAGEIVLAALRSANVVVMVQPPRGFGHNPIAIYHDPDLPPSHHYLAAYRWLQQQFGADAIVHVGKHGNLEWLPGKTAAMSAGCAADAAIGSLPLIYPFLVNDPGEGTQAKRRVHATIIDHLVPPMARAESYGDIARLEQLLDEHSQIASMDPAKLPAIRAQIWTLIQAAKLDHDLGLADRPDDDSFDELILHVDGWLCEIKDAQIRDGLHILGQAPVGEARVNLILTMLRARQMWSGKVAALPGLREALGYDESSNDRLGSDRVEQLAHALVAGMEAGGWTEQLAEPVTVEVLGRSDEQVSAVLRFAAAEIVPRLAGTVAEIEHVLHALDGGFIPAGPSGSPLRGLINVLPTGRNFYSVDPRAIPSQLAWETGQAMAESLLERYLLDEQSYPDSVGLSIWGTSAMRTAGDDIAEVLALIGVRPTWDEASRRINGIAAIPLAELGRPRIDVTVRISGFFRDAFPHVVAMLDEAIRLVSELDEPAEHNYLRAHVEADFADYQDRRRATTRIFGSKPGAYGAGLLQLMDSGNWRSDADIAEVYTAWGGYAYGQGLDGRQATTEMQASYRRISIAAKNADTLEHDIMDSDDYFQYHGGMVATVRALSGSAPRAYVGDSTRPDQVRTRTLKEETTRIYRARVINPRWIAAMRRHGYKGAFELAATVDYLFGYDATTGVVEDWMYEQLTETYLLDPENRKFLEESNPWALHGMAERLLEAVERKLWSAPDPALLAQLRAAYLQTEGELEGD